MTNPSNYQQNVGAWIAKCFAEQPGAADIPERAQRFMEESVELVQSCGMPIEHAHQLVDYVYGRPVGEPEQEVGGVMVTLAGFCNTIGVQLDAAAWKELARCWANVDKIRAKNATKKTELPTPGTAPLTATDAENAVADAVLREHQRARIESEAWQMYCDDNRNNRFAATSWDLLPLTVRNQYVQRVIVAA